MGETTTIHGLDGAFMPWTCFELFKIKRQLEQQVITDIRSSLFSLAEQKRRKEGWKCETKGKQERWALPSIKNNEQSYFKDSIYLLQWNSRFKFHKQWMQKHRFRSVAQRFRSVAHRFRSVQLHIGFVQLHKGFVQLHIGFVQLHIGFVQLHIGFLQLHKGFVALHKGFASFNWVTRDFVTFNWHTVKPNNAP